MPEMTGTITGPGGAAPASPADRRVVITLVDLNGRARVGFTTDDHEIVSTTEVTADASGDWSVTLPGNSGVDTDWGDTLYRITSGYDPDYREPFKTYVTVPASGGPYWVGDIRTTPPGGASPITGYLPLTGGTLTGALTLAADPVSALQAATKQYVDNASPGGSAAVTSVDGLTGAVSLTSVYLNQASNLSDVASAGAARTALGLGGAAVLSVGVIAGTVAAGDDSRLSDTRTPTAGSVVNASVSSSAAIAMSKLAVDPTARANHNGTQLASSVSDFDTQVRTSRLDQMAAPTGAVSLNSQRITNLSTAVSATDAATKSSVDLKLSLTGGSLTGNLSIGASASLAVGGAGSFGGGLGVISLLNATPAPSANPSGGVVLYASSLGVLTARDPNGVSSPLWSTYTTKGSDEGQATTTPQDVGSLSISVPGAGVYWYEAWLPFTSSSATNGINLRLKSSGAPTTSFLSYWISVQSSNTTITTFYQDALDSAVDTTTATSTSTRYQGRIYGLIIATSAGTLVPQWAIGAGAAATATIKAGAFATLRRVA